MYYIQLSVYGLTELEFACVVTWLDVFEYYVIPIFAVNITVFPNIRIIESFSNWNILVVVVVLVAVSVVRLLWCTFSIRYFLGWMFFSLGFGLPNVKALVSNVRKLGNRIYFPFLLFIIIIIVVSVVVLEIILQNHYYSYNILD